MACSTWVSRENPDRGHGFLHRHFAAYAEEIFASDLGFDALSFKEAFDEMGFERVLGHEYLFHRTPPMR